MTASEAHSRRSLGRLLLEVFFIVLGVMVALAGNEWRENRALAKRTNAALENHLADRPHVADPPERRLRNLNPPRHHLPDSG